MSCYFRHIKNIMDEAGIEVTPSNKIEIDRVFHEIVGVNYKDCPTTWKRLKQCLTGDEKKQEELINELKNVMR